MGNQQSAAGGMIWIPRGVTDAYDFTVADFVFDSTWRDLDLSGIIAAGAKLVILDLYAGCVNADKWTMWREKGGNEGFNASRQRNLVPGTALAVPIIVSPDANGVVQYYGNTTTWATYYLTVRGWFI